MKLVKVGITSLVSIHNWSERKTKLFKDEYIQIAYDHLDTFVYFSNKPSLGSK